MHGRLALQDAVWFSASGSAAGAGAADDALGNLRLTWEPVWGPWQLQTHYLLSAEDGPAVAQLSQEESFIRLSPATWLNLTGTLARSGSLTASQALDRVNLAYTSPQWVVRLGRQAITWGSGLVFKPMDLVDPFSPAATDTEYKPGVDMLYVQRLFADGSDLQMIAAPRPKDVEESTPTAAASSEALHYRTNVLGHSVTLLAARDHGDWVGGAGVNGSLAGATWNLELVPTVTHGMAYISGVANISSALTLAGYNATVFAEYYHNGFGVAGQPFDLADLPPDLMDRLARGQLFTLRRNYLAGGTTLQANPLLTVSPSLITGLDDGSLLLLLAASYSLSDNLVLAGGVQLPVGRRGTEYGGVPFASGDPTLLEAPRQIYLQLRRYF
jgi:hypothetical protein